METPQSSSTSKEFEITGVSRSGRLRKKSSKLLDFQSLDEVEKKPKRSTRHTARYGGRGRPSLATMRARKGAVSTNVAGAAALPDEDDDMPLEAGDSGEDLDDTIAAEDHLGTEQDSDDEIDELVADLVEGVEAENLEHNAGNPESKVRQSLYMTEKTNKRRVLKDGRIVKGKVERKDKGKSRFTAYSLWAREFRKTSKFSKNQDLDFSNAARRLGELWANVSNKEKNAWRRKAKMMAAKAKALEKSGTTATEMDTSNNSANPNASFANRATTSRTRKLAAERQKDKDTASPIVNSSTNNTSSSPRRKRNNSHKAATNNTLLSATTQSSTSNNVTTANAGASSISTVATVANNKVQLPSIEPIDAAAHLKLLGESLTIIGERLKEHEGQIAVSGSLSVLLDSLLCSLGPLLCLTTRIPGLEKKPQLSANLAATLDNIAYVMPGL